MRRQLRKAVAPEREASDAYPETGQKRKPRRRCQPARQPKRGATMAPHIEGPSRRRLRFGPTNALFSAWFQYP